MSWDVNAKNYSHASYPSAQLLGECLHGLCDSTSTQKQHWNAVSNTAGRQAARQALVQWLKWSYREPACSASKSGWLLHGSSAFFAITPVSPRWLQCALRFDFVCLFVSPSHPPVSLSLLPCPSLQDGGSRVAQGKAPSHSSKSVSFYLLFFP